MANVIIIGNGTDRDMVYDSVEWGSYEVHEIDNTKGVNRKLNASTVLIILCVGLKGQTLSEAIEDLQTKLFKAASRNSNINPAVIGIFRTTGQRNNYRNTSITPCGIGAIGSVIIRTLS